MLGNWSFGDYFKEEAINWSWELLTKEYGINPNDLYVTIFEGSKEDGVSEDSEAFNFWSKIIAVSYTHLRAHETGRNRGRRLGG